MIKKLNDRGFVLAETVVVAAFMITIFSIMYMNFYPLMAEYEKREAYDDLDSKYAAYWVKRIIQDDSYNLITPDKTSINDSTYCEFNCNRLSEPAKQDQCTNMITKLEIDKVYITKYNIETFKEKVKNTTDTNIFSSGMQDYVKYLPKYTKESNNGASYRVIIQFKRNITTTSETQSYYTYSTIEVIK